MKIRRLTPDDRESFARLMHYAFEPTNNTYDNVVPEDYELSKPYLKDVNQAYGVFDEELLVAICCYFSSNVIIRSKEFPMSGIWGVATSPHYRRQGLIKKLFNKIFPLMKEDGIIISILYPFKFSFYEQLGYRLANINHRYHIETEQFKFRPVDSRIIKEVTELDDIKQVYSNIASRKYNYMIQRTEEDWNRRINAKRPGYFFVCYDESQNPCGYLIAHFMEHAPPSEESVDKSENTIYLSEFFWKDRETKQALINFLKLHTDHRKYVVFSTAETSILGYLKEARIKANEVFPGSMIRIIDIKSVLESFGYCEDLECVLQVIDTTCEWNNKSYSFITKNGKASLDETTSSPDITIDIGPLSQMVVGFRTATQLYDTWEITGSKKFLNKLDNLFPPQVNFFRDFF
jgi:predicted acetyltransferase